MLIHLTNILLEHTEFTDIFYKQNQCRSFKLIYIQAEQSYATLLKYNTLIRSCRVALFKKNT